MHDMERGGNPTAARLAALAALRHAQADGTQDEEDTEQTGRGGTQDGHGQRADVPDSGASAADPDPAPTRGQDMSAGVYAAVEAAVKKSRIEFLARLLEYRRKLDCDAFRAAHPNELGASLDDAQFVAHRIAGVGKTLGFADLGDIARQAEAAITAYKLESSADLHQLAVARICQLTGLIETTCADQDDCPAC